jgi:hypothetical protein
MSDAKVIVITGASSGERAEPDDQLAGADVAGDSEDFCGGMYLNAALLPPRQ